MSVLLRGLAPLPAARKNLKMVVRVFVVSYMSAALAILMAATPSALSTQDHAFSKTFGTGTSGPGDGELSLTAPKTRSNPLIGGSGLAVNGSTGDVFVADTGNRRVDEFSSTGSFIGAFGADVGGLGVDVCTSGCLRGTSGSSPGQLAEPNFIAVDNSGGESNGDIYVATGVGRRALEEEQHLQINNATGGTFTLTFEGDTTSPALPYNASPTEVQDALTSLSTIGTGNVGVGFEERGAAGMQISFRNALAGKNVPQITADATGLTPAGATVEVTTKVDGSPYTPELVDKFSSEGKLIQTWGNGGASESANGQLVGSAAKKFEPLAGMTVDSSGNLWVYDQKPTMFEFSQDGGFIQDWSGFGISPFGITVAGAQDFYTPYISDEAVERVTSEGAGLGRLVAPSVITGLTYNGASNELYRDDAGSAVEDISPQCEFFPHACAPTQIFGTGHLDVGGSLAVDSASGTVYAVSSADGRIAVFPVTIAAVISPATNVGGVTATLHGKINPEGSELTAPCEFEYGTSNNYGKVAKCEGASPKGSSPVAVEAKISDLSGGTVYHFRLRAANANGKVHSEDETLSTLAAPVIDKAEVKNLTATSAELTADIDPEGSGTTYHFEYDTQPYARNGGSHGIEVPVGGQAIGSGTSGVAVSQSIGGLAPNTTYDFRVVATNANATITGPDMTFVFTTSGPKIITECANHQLRVENKSAGLPDCRGYEMVNPSYTGGFTVAHSYVGAGIVIGASFGAFAGAENNPAFMSQYQFTRTSTGWNATPLDPPASELPQNISTTEFFSPDLLSSINSRGVADPGSTANPDEEFYLRDASGHFTAIGPTGPPGTPYSEFHQSEVESTAAGASADLSHLLFDSISKDNGPPWPGDRTFHEHVSLFEYHGVGNTTPVMVAVKEDGKLISQCGASLGAIGVGGESGGAAGSQHNAVSDSGETVFFSTAPGGCLGAIDANAEVEEAGEGPPVVEIYARRRASETVKISEPTVSGPGADCIECQESSPASAVYLAASIDGSKVLFSTEQELLPGNPGNNLYEYDFDGAAGHKLIAISHLTSGEEAAVQGLATTTPDLSHIFFVAKGILTGENAEHESPIEGQDNLYVYEPDPHHQGDQRTVFIATLAPGVCSSSSCNGDAIDWRGFDENTEPVKVTPDGRFLIFHSMADLTSDDTSMAAQLFRYDAQEEKLIRLSIGSKGYNNNGNGSGTVPVGSEAYDQPTEGAAEGAYAFFDSEVPLVPEAGGSAGFNSVYEWAADGTGACEEVQGCVYLISDGQDKNTIVSLRGSLLAGISPTGTDVYFETADSLISTDTNTQQTIYDARANGGFPIPAGVEECASTETCQPKGSGSAGAASSTSVFSGPINPVPVAGSSAKGQGVGKCTKGQRLVRGKCVKSKAIIKCAKGRKVRRGRCVKIKARKGRKTVRVEKARGTVGGSRKAAS